MCTNRCCPSVGLVLQAEKEPDVYTSPSSSGHCPFDQRQWTYQHLQAANITALTPPQGDNYVTRDVDVRGPGEAEE